MTVILTGTLTELNMYPGTSEAGQAIWSLIRSAKHQQGRCDGPDKSIYDL